MEKPVAVVRSSAPDPAHFNHHVYKGRQRTGAPGRLAKERAPLTGMVKKKNPQPCFCQVAEACQSGA